MTQAAPTFDRPVSGRRRPGGHKKGRQDDPGSGAMTLAADRARPATGLTEAASGATPAEPDPAQPLLGVHQGAPLPPVSHETAPLDIAALEAEAQRRGLTRPIEAMTDAELMAELQRRRGGTPVPDGPMQTGQLMSGGSMAVPPPSANDTRIEGDLSRPLPRFTADPHAEARRLLELDNKEPAYVPGASAVTPAAALPRVVAVRQPELPPAVVDEGGSLVRTRPEPADANNPFPARITPEGGEDVWYEIALPGGGTARVRASDVVIESLPPAPAADGEAPTANYRCVSPAPGCPDFYLDPTQVPPGAYPRCPTCGDKRLLPLF